MNSNHLIHARQTAAEVLAAAAIDLFPNTLLLQGRGTDRVFFYDFLFLSDLDQQALSFLEERMRVLLKQKPVIKALNMMASNAAVRMEHQQRQPWIAEQLLQAGRAVVQMIQIGDFVDWSEEPFLDKWESHFVFKLLEFYPIQVGEHTAIRIVGALFASKSELKEFVKTAPSFANHAHARICQELGYLAPVTSLGNGFWTWLPKGERVRQTLVAWWQTAHKEQNFEFITTPASVGADLTRAHSECLQQGPLRVAEISYVHRTENEPRLKEGLFEAAGWITDRAYLLCRDEELLNECISSLQFIAKIPKILGFESQIVLYSAHGGAQKRHSKGTKGLRFLQQALEESALSYTSEKSPHEQEGESRIVVRFPDALGRWWDGPFLSVVGMPKIKVGHTLLSRSTFGSWERLMALLIEQRKGELPSWLALNNEK